MSTSAPTAASTKRREVTAAAAGTVVEFYDLTIYAYLAVVLSPLFFPNEDPTASLLASLAVFASAYAIRPIGGIVLGRLGDRHGRKRALYVSVVLMGVGSTLMALLPTYETAGLLAPVLLVVARLIQGFSAGGEFGSALTYVFETADDKRKGFSGSFVTFGSNGGFALAAIAVGTVTALTTDEQMNSWGWRVPFILGIPLRLFSIWTRSRIGESEDFEKLAGNNDTLDAPLRYTLRNNLKQVTQVFGLAVAQSATGYMILTYMAIYLVNEAGYGTSVVAWTTAGIISLIAVLTPFVGMLVDRFGSKRILIVGLLWSGITAYPAMSMMHDHGYLTAVIAYFVFAIGAPLVQIANAPLLPSLFGPEARLTGVAFGFNCATCLAGGTAAYISTWLIDATSNQQSPAFFVIVTCLVGGVAALSLRKAVVGADRTDKQSPIEA